MNVQLKVETIEFFTSGYLPDNQSKIYNYPLISGVGATGGWTRAHGLMVQPLATAGEGVNVVALPRPVPAEESTLQTLDGRRGRQ